MIAKLSRIVPGLVVATCLQGAGEQCAGCHKAIVESYARTGMARSFAPMASVPRIEDFTRANRFTHAASTSTFTMTERGGRFFARRHQVDPRGREFNVLEREIHYVLGSGAHARGYVYRTAEGRLLSLPVTWYAEQGGYWHMAPGYDRADHPHFRRRIGYDCMFCHNSYPRAGPDPGDPVYEGELPAGIGCERCHGDPTAHLRGGAIVNPKRFPPHRQLELCMQCHLETTSFPLPASLRRFGRGYFSYRPDEPLANYMVHFDHQGRDEKFEVVSAVYRLRQSECFRQSKGRLTCTTCHDPHSPAAANDGACVNCHAATPRHGGEGSCSACHMAPRRPEDAPRTTITDHWIARRPVSPAPASTATDYRGPVIAYYPRDPGEPYVAIANAERDWRPLSQFISRRRPVEAEPYQRLCEVLPAPDAIGYCEEAARRLPYPGNATRRLALLRFPDDGVVRAAIVRSPRDPFFWIVRGEALRLVANWSAAESAFAQAITLDPDTPDAFLDLGTALAQQGRYAEAAVRFRDALAIDPANKAAGENLRKLANEPGK